ncbi:hypothetical protein Q8A73_011141 [Channa argus]|nr:hypothetical protein Q8A73_011141 [Channa argus]
MVWMVVMVEMKCIPLIPTKLCLAALNSAPFVSREVAENLLTASAPRLPPPFSKDKECSECLASPAVSNNETIGAMVQEPGKKSRKKKKINWTIHSLETVDYEQQKNVRRWSVSMSKHSVTCAERVHFPTPGVVRKHIFLWWWRLVAHGKKWNPLTHSKKKDFLRSLQATFQHDKFCPELQISHAPPGGGVQIALLLVPFGKIRPAEAGSKFGSVTDRWQDALQMSSYFSARLPIENTSPHPAHPPLSTTLLPPPSMARANSALSCKPQAFGLLVFFNKLSLLDTEGEEEEEEEEEGKGGRGGEEEGARTVGLSPQFQRVPDGEGAAGRTA